MLFYHYNLIISIRRILFPLYRKILLKRIRIEVSCVTAKCSFSSPLSFLFEMISWLIFDEISFWNIWMNELLNAILSRYFFFLLFPSHFMQSRKLKLIEWGMEEWNVWSGLMVVNFQHYTSSNVIKVEMSRLERNGALRTFPSSIKWIHCWRCCEFNLITYTFSIFFSIQIIFTHFCLLCIFFLTISNAEEITFK